MADTEWTVLAGMDSVSDSVTVATYVDQAEAARDAAQGFETGAEAAADAAATSAALAQSMAEDGDVGIVAANITTIQDAAGDLTAIQTAMLQMATAFTNSQTRYVTATAFA